MRGIGQLQARSGKKGGKKAAAERTKPSKRDIERDLNCPSVKELFAALDACKKAPESLLEDLEVEDGIHPGMLRRLFGDGNLPGGAITGSRSYKSGSAAAFCFDLTPTRDSGEVTLSRQRPPALLDVDEELPEFELHQQFDAKGKRPSDHSRRCLECIIKVNFTCTCTLQSQCPDMLNPLLVTLPFRECHSLHTAHHVISF